MKDDQGADQAGCAGTGDYVSWEEELVLKRMRELKEEAAQTKAEIARLSKEPEREDELGAAREKLEELKGAFRELERARDEARTHKMRALGHED